MEYLLEEKEFLQEESLLHLPCMQPTPIGGPAVEDVDLPSAPKDSEDDEAGRSPAQFAAPILAGKHSLLSIL
jgi:hypothetical protein